MFCCGCERFAWIIGGYGCTGGGQFSGYCGGIIIGYGCYMIGCEGWPIDCMACWFINCYCISIMGIIQGLA